MCARRPTSAMPKPFLCCERAFCCSMVVMWPVLMHVMSFDVVVMSFHAMWLLVLCHVTWCNAMSCDVPCNGHVVCSKWFCDNVVIQSTILYYKVLFQYYSVLQSTTPVLLCSTQCYNVLLQYYFVLQSSIHMNRHLHDRCPSHMKRHVQCAEQQESSSNFTKYCTCHAKWLWWLIRVTYETSFTMRGATGLTIQLYQILRLPRKKSHDWSASHIWNVI